MGIRLWICVGVVALCARAGAQEQQAEEGVEAPIADEAVDVEETEETVAAEEVDAGEAPNDSLRGQAESAAELPVIYAVPAGAPATEAPATEAPSPEESREAATPEESPEAEEPSNTDPLPEPRRLVLATTLGGLAGVVGGFGLSWGPAFVWAATNDSSDDALLAGYVMGATTWGTPLTTAVGIFAAGRAAGGRGNYGVTLLGTSVGGIVGAGLASLAVWSETSQALSIVGVLTIPILQWAGGVLAYHLSHRALSRRRPSEPQRALPSVQILRGGGALTWATTF